jgi:hypothetical protein
MVKWQLLLSIKICSVAMCIAFAFTSHHPPAIAQQLSSEDTAQDHDITGLSHRMDAADARMTLIEERVRNVAESQADSNGERRVEFAVLGLLLSGSIGLQLKGKKQA